MHCITTTVKEVKMLTVKSHGLNVCIKGSEVTPLYSVVMRMTGDQIVVNGQDKDFKQLIDEQSTTKLSSVKMLHKITH